jgi:hypothetical protein
MEAIGFARAATSGAIWAAVAYGLAMVSGAPVSMNDLALDAGLMAGASVGADVIHAGLGMQPTGVTSAAATGAVFAGLQAAVRGDENYLVNGAAAAGNDALVEVMYASWS